MRKTADITVKTDRVAVGQEFKNYKELCEGLQIDKSKHKASGCQKKAILKEIERYVRYEKSGQKFIIKEIYDEPLPKEDKRLEGKYVKYTELILCKYLVSKTKEEPKTVADDEKAYNLTPVNWFKIFGLCNARYGDKRYLDDFFELETLNQDAIHEFYVREDDRLKKILTSSLNSLTRQRLINYSVQYILGFDEKDQRKATEEEVGSIRNAEHDVLEEMGLHDTFQLRYRSLSQKFYAAVTERLREDVEKDNIIDALYDEGTIVDEDIDKYERKYLGDFSDLVYYYKVIEIKYSYARIKNRLKKLIADNEEELTVLDAIRHNNDTVTDSLHDSIKKKQDKIMIGSVPSLNTYAEQQNYLIDKLIKFEKDELAESCQEFFNSRNKHNKYKKYKNIAKAE